MDDKLSKNALALAKWAPILLLFNGYWMLGNQQIFMNQWNYIMMESDPMPSGHFMPERLQLSWTTPIYIFLFASLVIILAQAIVPRSVLSSLGFTLQAKDIVVDEDLPNFFTVMKPQQASNLTEEAKNMRNEYRMETADPRVLETLEHKIWPAKAIQGTPFYNVLSNSVYADQFCYIGADVPEREKLIEDGDSDDDNNCEQSDLVMILLNLSCVPDSVATSFTFQSGFKASFESAMRTNRKDFEHQFGIKWEYENDRLVDRYLRFKRGRTTLTNNLEKANYFESSHKRSNFTSLSTSFPW